MGRGRKPKESFCSCFSQVSSLRGRREGDPSFDLPMEEQMGGSEDRWRGSLENITEMASNLDSLQKLLLKKAVFVEEDTFSRASLVSEQARTIKVLEQRVQTLERELDAAITAAAHARSEKRQAESSQKAAETRALEVTKELENTTKVFKLHMEELRGMQEQISKRDNEIKLLEAIIQTLGGKERLRKSGVKE